MTKVSLVPSRLVDAFVISINPIAISSFIAPSTVFPGLQTGTGVGVKVAVGSGVEVGGIGDAVNVGGTGVDVGSGVGAGAHPFTAKTVRSTNRSNIDPNDFFMTFLL
jgi:hypothetical protein